MKTCNGINLSGYWKGYKCGAVAKYSFEDKGYCANHYPPLVEMRRQKKLSRQKTIAQQPKCRK